jgi:glycosyltransferase involved in cell wall biosynthesis
VKIAIVHPYPVHSGAVGGTTRVYALVRHLAGAGHVVTVLAHGSGKVEADRAAVGDLASLGATQKLFPLVKPPLRERLGWTTGPIPYYVHRNRNPALEDELARIAPDLVHVEAGYLAPLLDRLDPRVPRTLAEQETMSLAVDRLRTARGRSPWELFLLTQRRKIAAFEQQALAGFHRVWAISAAEAEHLGRLLGHPVEILPHVVDTRSFQPGQPSAEPAAAPRLLFVGNYAHRPNWHALLWLLSQVWPRIRAQVPEAQLEAVGPGLDTAKRERVERAGATAPGRVDDLAAAYRGAAVFVNPIRSGGGMRGKILEAFACGCAVVSTGMGMEGVDARSGEHCLVADAAEELAAAVVRYLREPALRREHGRAARALVERNYDPGRVFPRLEAAFAEAIEQRRRSVA